MVDKNLFIYLTKNSGHSLADAAQAMNLSVASLSKRLNGSISFRAPEMSAWMALTHVVDAGPIFFPDFVAEKQQY